MIGSRIICNFLPRVKGASLMTRKHLIIRKIRYRFEIFVVARVTTYTRLFL
jgi:hypothetical protein